MKSTRQTWIRRSGFIVACAAVALGSGAYAASNYDPRAEIAAVESAAFAQADADGSGTLTPAEFSNFTELMRAQLDTLRFNRADANGDGVLTQDELEAARPMGPPHGPGF